MKNANAGGRCKCDGLFIGAGSLAAFEDVISGITHTHAACAPTTNFVETVNGMLCNCCAQFTPAHEILSAHVSGNCYNCGKE